MNTKKTCLSVRPINRLVICLLLVITATQNISSVAAMGATIYIGGSNGGECSLVGNWDETSLTCTLTQDLYDQGIEVTNDHITLDGNGHAIVAGPNVRTYGVTLFYRTGVTVQNLVINGFGFGVFVYRSVGNLITLNQINPPATYLAIYLSQSYDNTVSQNQTSGEIQIVRSYNNLITGNTVTSSPDSNGIRIASGHHNAVSDNRISGATWSGIDVVLENNSTVVGNEVFSSRNGIELYSSSSNNIVRENNIHDNAFGIYVITACTQNTITENQLLNNTYGVTIESSSNNNIVTYNSISNSSGRGMLIGNSSGNQVYRNNFTNNNRPYPWFKQLILYRVTDSAFNLPAPIGGNYWSDFDEPSEGCQDVNNDGFCDAPYLLPNGFDLAPGNQDNMPWAKPSGWLNQPPIANAGGPYFAESDTVLMLDGSNSTDPENNITTYEWDLNADGVYDMLGVMITTSFSQIGDHLVTLRVTDDGGLSDTDTATVTITDKTPPVITPTISGTGGRNGWYISDVTVSWDVSDPESGIASSVGCDTTTLTAETVGDTLTCSATNGAGLSNSASATISIDKTAPSITWIGDIDDGDNFYFGSVPTESTCTASDNLSGLDGSCAVSGYTSTVGLHTLTATAKDNAGNQSTETRTYTVLAWTLHGFYQPVDMNGVYNIVKSGSTVPLKFEIFADTNELTDIAYIKSLTYAQTSCDASATTDEVETTATGGTSLRYDVAAGQFVYNWKTPKSAGKCYRVTMDTVDGSTLMAYFKLK